MRRCLVLALLVTVCPLAFAQAYKWKDAQGVTHYADSPPAGNVRYEKIKTSGTVEAPDPAAAAAAAAPPKDKPTANAGGTSDTPANRVALCAQLAKNLDILHKEAIVTMDDGKGGVKQVDAAGREAQIKSTEAQRTLYCPQS